MKNNEIPLLPSQFYHIYNHANGHENLFVKRENYYFFLQRYATFINPIADTFAYCLMPNHLHLLVRIKDEDDLQTAYQQKIKLRAEANFPKVLTARAAPFREVEGENFREVEVDTMSKFVSREFGSLFSSYSQAFNKQQNRKGSLFIPNFKRKLIDTEDYFTQLVHYIHANPVHHGFVRRFTDWEFSSYHAFLSDKNTNLQRDEVLGWFGGVNDFKKFHDGMPIKNDMVLELEY